VSDGVQFRQNSQRRGGESEAGAREQGPHIPSVSQMLKLAHISDTGPPSNSSQTPASSSSGASASHEQSVSSGQGPSNQGCFRTGRHDPQHTQFETLRKMKLAMDETTCAKKEGEMSFSNVAAASRNIVTTNGQLAESLATAANTFTSSDGEQPVSQSAMPVSCSENKDSTEVITSPDLPASVKGMKKSDLLCEGDNLNAKNMRNSPYGECSDTASSCKKRRVDGTDFSKRSAAVDTSCNSQSDSCIRVTGEGVCASSSSTPVVPPVNTTTTTATTTTTTTTTAVTSSSTEDPSNVPGSSAVKGESSGASGHHSSDSWCRYGSANVTVNASGKTESAASAPSSQHQQVWRISRRVYLRRPRLLALGPRSRNVCRQLSSNGTSSQKNYAAGIFR
jgi:hypothetical protein